MAGVAILAAALTDVALSAHVTLLSDRTSPRLPTPAAMSDALDLTADDAAAAEQQQRDDAHTQSQTHSQSMEQEQGERAPQRKQAASRREPARITA